MDRLINSKVDKHSIYEIYRACRLCGAGAGYKMPIIQNVIDIDGEEVDLKQKIRECVQIEVHQDDKMPPLICELCVDKVNDFYVFLEMCQQTNKRTRQRLGLPLQTTHKGTSDSGDCILGVTEPVYVNEDSDEPLSRSSTRNVKFKGSKVKKPEIKVENSRDSRVSRNSKHIESTKSGSQKRTRSPEIGSRSTRQRNNSNEDNLTLSNLRHQSRNKRSPTGLPPPPKSILKKESKVDDRLGLRSKRTQESMKSAVPPKKVKLAVKMPQKPERRAPPSPPGIKCNICKYHSKTPQANANHMRSHTVTFTSNKLSCNSCREWFADADAAADHHRRHKARSKAYICRACKRHYQTYHPYLTHTQSGDCVPWEEVPDVKCDECWKYFPTDNLRTQHKCPGVDGRPGGKCSKCSRAYALLKNLKKHESMCSTRKRGEPDIDPALLAKLKPVRILTVRCDPLLDKQIDGHYRVADVPHNYGLDPASIYPYINSASLNFNRMVNIKSELDFYCEEDYVHWDSDVSSDDDVTEKDSKVYSLSVLALKTLFSQKCLGRVPRKRRRIKTEKSVFDSIMGNDFDMSKDIDSIIDNLGDDDNVDVSRDDGRKLNEDDGTAKEQVSETDNAPVNILDDRVNEVDTEKSEDVSTDIIEDKSTENIDNSENKDDANESESKEVDAEKLSNKTVELDNSTSELSKDIGTDKESILDNKDVELEEIERKETLVDANVISNADQKISQIEDKLEDSERNDEIKQSTDESDCIPNNKNIEQESVESKEDINNVDDDKNKNEETKDDLNENITVNSQSVDFNKDEHINDGVILNSDKEVLNEVSNSQTTDNLDETDNVNGRLSNDNLKTIDTDSNDVSFKTDVILDKEEIDTNNTDIHENSDVTDPNETDKYNDSSEEKSDKLNMEDFNEVCDSEIDDKKLMEALDEHIGESKENNYGKCDVNNDSTVDGVDKSIDNDIKSVEDASENIKAVKKVYDSNVNEQNKITLDDLLPKKVGNTPSMDLDNISDDELNFE
ncbi:unnamed protein product [Diatraea saccharalis]|uniref:ZAD domain-containing protein n=1 Tax=Diatraea saccharalis TaxID=40085 RepID=A0A9N9WG67_9NEOP|nr:unnamed protein product [Diatraea saccharalis]